MFDRGYLPVEQSGRRSWTSRWCLLAPTWCFRNFPPPSRNVGLLWSVNAAKTLDVVIPKRMLLSTSRLYTSPVLTSPPPACTPDLPSPPAADAGSSIAVVASTLTKTVTDFLFLLSLFLYPLGLWNLKVFM